jgi:hypothetical protein
MRISAAALAGLAICASTGAGAATPAPVNHDRPGALDTNRHENPADYNRITQIIDLAATMPCQSPAFPRMLKARYDASGFCGLSLLTSYPAKRHFTFELGGVAYETNVTMRDSGGKLVHAVEAPGPAEPQR